MARFRKRPVVIEAEQWWPGTVIPGVQVAAAWPPAGEEPVLQAWVDTLEGRMLVSPGDWIIRGVAGELYPCKDEIFRQTYDPVDDDEEEMLARADIEHALSILRGMKQSGPPGSWIVLIAEALGLAVQAHRQKDLGRYRECLAQVAALALLASTANYRASRLPPEGS